MSSTKSVASSKKREEDEIRKAFKDEFEGINRLARNPTVAMEKAENVYILSKVSIERADRERPYKVPYQLQLPFPILGYSSEFLKEFWAKHPHLAEKICPIPTQAVPRQKMADLLGMPSGGHRQRLPKHSAQIFLAVKELSTGSTTAFDQMKAAYVAESMTLHRVKEGETKLSTNLKYLRHFHEFRPQLTAPEIEDAAISLYYARNWGGIKSKVHRELRDSSTVSMIEGLSIAGVHPSKIKQELHRVTHPKAPLALAAQRAEPNFVHVVTESYRIHQFPTVARREDPLPVLSKLLYTKSWTLAQLDDETDLDETLVSIIHCSFLSWKGATLEEVYTLSDQHTDLHGVYIRSKLGLASSLIYHKRFRGTLRTNEHQTVATDATWLMVPLSTPQRIKTTGTGFHYWDQSCEWYVEAEYKDAGQVYRMKALATVSQDADGYLELSSFNMSADLGFLLPLFVFDLAQGLGLSTDKFHQYRGGVNVCSNFGLRSWSTVFGEKDLPVQHDTPVPGIGIDGVFGYHEAIYLRISTNGPGLSFVPSTNPHQWYAKDGWLHWEINGPALFKVEVPKSTSIPADLYVGANRGSTHQDLGAYILLEASKCLAECLDKVGRSEFDISIAGKACKAYQAFGGYRMPDPGVDLFVLGTEIRRREQEVDVEIFSKILIKYCNTCANKISPPDTFFGESGCFNNGVLIIRKHLAFPFPPRRYQLVESSDPNVTEVINDLTEINYSHLANTFYFKLGNEIVCCDPNVIDSDLGPSRIFRNALAKSNRTQTDMASMQPQPEEKEGGSDSDGEDAL